MFRLTNLATSHLPETDNIFYWQILKNWHFFHITAEERHGNYSSHSSKSRLWFTDIQENELSPFYGPRNVLDAEDTKVSEVQSYLQNTVSPNSKSTDCLQHMSFLCLLFGFDLGVIMETYCVKIKNTR